jgi:hypothetical protein
MLSGYIAVVVECVNCRDSMQCMHIIEYILSLILLERKHHFWVTKTLNIKIMIVAYCMMSL